MNIYEVLNKIITETHYYSMSNLFTEEDRETLEEQDAILFDLLKNISSLRIAIDNGSITFHPKLTFIDGSRTFGIEDITENDFHLLTSIELEKLPLPLKALLSDVLWSQRKNYGASQIAVHSYWEIFQLLYESKKYNQALNPLKRAVCISIQTNSQSIYSVIYEWFCNQFICNVVNVDVFCSLRIMELFFDQKNTDFSLIVSAADSIISKNNNNPLAVEQAYELKTKCLFKMKKKDEATGSNLALAQYYYDYAEGMQNSDAFRSVSFLQKSIILFRNNGDTSHAENAHRKLIDVQKQIPKNMHIFRTQFDLTKAIENIKINLDGLSFEECIIRLTQYIGFEPIDILKKKIIDECAMDPLASIFETHVLDTQGRTIVKLAPLDDKEPEKDPNLLELYMFQYSLKEQRSIGDLWIKNILQYIRSNFSIDNSMIDFIVNSNCIIPEGRETIFQKGIGKFLRGEYYEAMHILAPQMENLFRNIANEVGGLTSTLSDDGLSQEKVLSSVFTLPELLDAYNSNIIFAFRGLLNEQAGANIRNRIAHGIIEESECSSGECLFFGALVIKFLLLTSPVYYKIIHSMKKLIQPNDDDIKIIK